MQSIKLEKLTVRRSQRNIQPTFSHMRPIANPVPALRCALENPFRSSRSRFLFKPHLFVVESLAIQHFHGELTQTTEQSISRRTLRKDLSQRFASVFHRQILRRRLTRCSVEGADLRVRNEYRFRRNGKLCVHASAFFNHAHCKMGPAQSEFRWRAAEERECNSG